MENTIDMHSKTASTVTLKEYDYDARESKVVGEVSTYTLCRSITPENFAVILDEYLNLGGKGSREGEEIGKALRSTHRTLQGSMVEFAFGLLKGISQQEYTDARNESAIKAAKKVTELRESGELDYQRYI